MVTGPPLKFNGTRGQLPGSMARKLPGLPDQLSDKEAVSGANVGATWANDHPAERTSADRRLAIIPGRKPIRTTLNALRVTTDL